jgi:cysteinyl-tRNA synthetase
MSSAATWNTAAYDVIHVMKYTDVDDKVIVRARQIGTDPLELAEKYIDQYDQQLKALNVLPATINPRATSEIPQIVSMIQGLGEGDYAYEVDGDVYFRVNRFKEYGKLSGRRLEDMQAGARIGVDERKEGIQWISPVEGIQAWRASLG